MGDAVSYRSQAQLEANTDFRGRATAAATEQADSYINDQRPDFVAVARDVLKGFPAELDAFVRLDAAGPGIADKVDVGDDSIDQTQVTDADLLSLTQANWQVVAGLYFDDTGMPKP
jgi:hypothetical protein